MHVDPRLVIFAVIGALAHWVLLRNASTLDKKVEIFVAELTGAGNWQRFVAIAIFVGLGALIGVVVVTPSTDRQAFVSGLAWTTMLSGLGYDGRVAPAKGKKLIK